MTLQPRRRLLRYFAVFLILIAVFTLSLFLVYSLPEGRIAENTESVLAAIRESGTQFPPVWFPADEARIDQFTDELMLSSVVPQDPDLNPLEAAMDMNNYPRYWHGYQVILRPLLLVFSGYQLRFLYMTAFFLLLALALFRIRDEAGTVPALALVAGLLACYMMTISMCMQHANNWLITFLALLVMFRLRNRTDRPWDRPLFFLVVGMLTSFVDLLTVPLITLCIPLSLLLLIDQNRDPDSNWKTAFKTLFRCSLAWGLGYALCWASKWLIGSLVLGRNLLSEAADQISFRTVGNEEFPGGPVEAIKQNLIAFLRGLGLSTHDLLPVILILALAALILTVCFFRGKKALAQGSMQLLVAAYPLVWYAVTSNHAIIHASLLTYRHLVITLFSGILFFCAIIDGDRLRRRLAAKKA